MPVDPENVQGWQNRCASNSLDKCDYCGKTIRQGQRFWKHANTNKCTHNEHLDCLLAENWQEIVTPGNVVLIDSADSSRITEVGTWNTVLRVGAIQGRTRRSSGGVANNYQEFTFYGVGVLLYCYFYPGYDDVICTLDGGVQANISTDAPFQRLDFVKYFPVTTKGFHTFRVTDGAVAGDQIEIDHYLIIEDYRLLHTLTIVENELNVHTKPVLGISIGGASVVVPVPGTPVSANVGVTAFEVFDSILIQAKETNIGAVYIGNTVYTPIKLYPLDCCTLTNQTFFAVDADNAGEGIDYIMT